MSLIGCHYLTSQSKATYYGQRGGFDCTLNVLHDTVKRLKEGGNTNTLVADIEQYIDDIKGVE